VCTVSFKFILQQRTWGMKAPCHSHASWRMSKSQVVSPTSNASRSDLDQHCCCCYWRRRYLEDHLLPEIQCSNRYWKHSQIGTGSIGDSLHKHALPLFIELAITIAHSRQLDIRHYHSGRQVKTTNDQCIIVQDV